MTLHDRGTRRLCIGCAAISEPTVNLRPEGWTIVPIRRSVLGLGASAVVGEKAYCPECQSAGKAVAL